MAKYCITFIRSRSFSDHAEVIVEAKTDTEAWAQANTILLSLDDSTWSEGDEEHIEECIGDVYAVGEKLT